jgi:hypothetical protein
MTPVKTKRSKTARLTSGDMARYTRYSPQIPDAKPTVCSHHQDPDWIADVKDRETNSEEHWLLWSLFRSRHLQSTVPTQLVGKFAMKFSRCRRIESKWVQIEAEFRAEQEVRLKRLGLLNDSPPLSEESLEIIRRRNMERVRKDFAEMKQRLMSKGRQRKLREA